MISCLPGLGTISCCRRRSFAKEQCQNLKPIWDGLQVSVSILSGTKIFSSSLRKTFGKFHPRILSPCWVCREFGISSQRAWTIVCWSYECWKDHSRSNERKWGYLLVFQHYIHTSIMTAIMFKLLTSPCPHTEENFSPSSNLLPFLWRWTFLAKNEFGIPDSMAHS